MERGRRGGPTQIQELIEGFRIVEIPCGAEHRLAAEDLFASHGKGVSPTGLNFGDCMVCALAQVEGEPLLTLDEGIAKTGLDLVPLD